jgi:hypothetical protein
LPSNGSTCRNILCSDVKFRASNFIVHLCFVLLCCVCCAALPCVVLCCVVLCRVVSCRVVSCCTAVCYNYLSQSEFIFFLPLFNLLLSSAHIWTRNWYHFKQPRSMVTLFEIILSIEEPRVLFCPSKRSARYVDRLLYHVNTLYFAHRMSYFIP